MTLNKDDIYIGMGDYNKKNFVECSRIADELDSYVDKNDCGCEECALFRTELRETIKTLRGGR